MLVYRNKEIESGRIIALVTLIRISGIFVFVKYLSLRSDRTMQCNKTIQNDTVYNVALLNNASHCSAMFRDEN